jgi:hypothetical protein
MARLFDKIEFAGADDCWRYTADWRSRFGYGRVREGGQDGRCLQAHVVMYEALVGPVPEGMWLRHTCDTPTCCNPRHLVPGTAADNRQDQYDHGAYSAQRWRPAPTMSQSGPALHPEVA